MALTDRDLVDADGQRCGLAGTFELQCLGLLLQRLDRMPVKAQLLGHVLDGRTATAPAYIEGISALCRADCPEGKSSFSCFTDPHCRQATRRTSNSRYTRVSPHDRSRTRRRCGRTSPDALYRRRHRLFFYAPLKADDTRLRITEDTAHRGFRPETGERIRLRQPSFRFECRHGKIMPELCHPSKTFYTRNYRVELHFRTCFYLHDYAKTQK